MIIKESDILNDIKEMLSQLHPKIEISMDTYLELSDGSCLNMSSLEIVEFIVSLEKRYDIIIDISDRYYTIGDVVRGVLSYIYEKDNN